MRLIERTPHEPLRRFVRNLWSASGVVPEAHLKQVPLLPDGCAELVIPVGDASLEIALGSSPPFRLHSPSLIGQSTHRVWARLDERVDLLGVRFEPHGARPFVSVPMSELTDDIVPITDVCPPALNEAIAKAVAEPTRKRRIASLQASLKRHVGMASLQVDRTDTSMLGPQDAEAIVRAIVDSDGRESIQALTGRLGWSSRRVRRWFLDRVGIPAKLLARIVRFRGALHDARVGRPGPSWAHVAADRGYCDQAHLIRDFRQFAGCSPAAFLDSTSALSVSSKTSG